MSSIVSCAAWISRGTAKAVPDKVELSEEQLQELINETQDKLRQMPDGNTDQTMEESLSQYRNVTNNDSDQSDDEETAILEEYGLDNYDNEGEGILMTGAGMAGLTYFANNEDDPYVTLKPQEDSDEEERDDINIKPTDNLIVVGKIEEELSHLEIHVYNEEDNDFYVHHDILLDTFPLALEAINYDPEDLNRKANFMAVGTMEPHIDVWDLDVIDTVDPVFTLGEKKPKKGSGNSPIHKDAVLDLSWNRNVKNVLCSGSADKTVILWDMKEGKAAQVLKQHKDKVQSVCWHPYEAQSLLSGSFDKTACVLDCRSPESGSKKWKLRGEVECVLWNHFSPFHFLASTDNGCIFCCDVRMDDPLFTIHAHDQAISAIALSSQLPGCLVSVSQDKVVKIWDIQDNKPSCVTSKEMKMGGILNVSACPDSPYVFALGGQKQGLKIFDLTQTANAWQHFESRQCLVNTNQEQPANKDEPDGGSKSEAVTDDVMDTEDASAVTAMESLTLQKDPEQPSAARKMNKKAKKHKKKFKKK